MIHAWMLVLIAATQDDPGRWKSVSHASHVDLYDVRFADEKSGWAVGDRGVILHTADGGKSWAPQKSPATQVLRGLDCLDARHVWVAGGGAGGARKGDPLSPGQDIDKQCFVLRSEDGGETWKEHIPGSVQNFPLWQLRMSDPKRGWLVSGLGKDHPDGHWLQTMDGGRTWEMPGGLGGTGMAYFRPGRPLYDLQFVGGGFGWAVGSHVLITITIDDGTGQRLESRLKLYRHKKGSIVHTTDGGETWNVQDAGNPEDVFLTGVWFVDKDQGWVVGTRGKIYATRDGGKTWRAQVSGTVNDLFALRFADAENGMAVGRGGTALSTSDGGKVWKSEKLPMNGDLLGLDYRGRRTPVLVGQGGVILVQQPELH
jgi:photosystem II stability/assembly factor-like uncharacterized protein